MVITPGDTLWWTMRPEALAYVDELVMDAADLERVRSERSESAYRAMVWKRLTALRDQGLLQLGSVQADWARATFLAERKIREILSDPAKSDAFLADMIFGYRYWIEFNRQRLQIMPVDYDYAESVLAHLPVWADDLAMLETRGKRAFIDRPEIVEQTARSILARVGALREIGKHNAGLGFASLKEFQPYIKYVDCEPGSPLPAGYPPSRSRAYLPPGHPAGWIDLPIEPDLGFLSPYLTKQAFWQRVRDLRERYNAPRKALAAVLECIDEARRSSASEPGGSRSGGSEPGGSAPGLAAEYAARTSELEGLESSICQGSNYLRGDFHGLTIVPSPALSAMLGAPPGKTGSEAGSGAGAAVAGAGADAPRAAFSPFWRAGDDHGDAPADAGPLEPCSVILESMLDLSRLERRARGKPRSSVPGRKLPPFWRPNGDQMAGGS